MGVRKRLHKGIRGLEKQIAKHRQKIQGYDGQKKILIDYWQAEIVRMLRQKVEKERRLRKKDE